MDLLRATSIEDQIVTLLGQGPATTHELLARVNERRACTKQGFYAALRALKKEEVVVIYRKTVSLNTSWLAAMQQELARMARAYAVGKESVGVFDLSERESVSFTFLDTRHLDTFWGHSQNLLIEGTPLTEAIYAYDPHYWFYIAREKTETALLELITRNGRQFLMTVGGDTVLDKAIRSHFASDLLQYHIEPLSKKSNYYVTVIGDYVTEVWLDTKIADQIDTLYAHASAVDEAVIRELEGFLTVRSKNKIRISRNRARAKQLKAKLGKHFFVKR